MNRLVRAELAKLRSLRTAVLFAAFAVAYPVLALLPAISAPAADQATMTADDFLRSLRGPAPLIAFTVLLVGVLLTAGEHRHGTIAASLLAVPRRGLLMAAKLGALAIAAAATAAAAATVALIGGTLFLRSVHVEVSPFGAKPLATAAAVIGVAVAYAWLGAGLGFLLRDQTAAIVSAIVWSTVVEGVLPVLFRAPGLRRWLPGDAAQAVVNVAERNPDLLPAAGGALLLSGVVLAVVAAGTAAFARRDVA